MICDTQPVRIDSRSSWLRGLRAIRVDGQLIEVVTTPCNFGGERRWFLCPGCGRRCAILRTGLRCNKCAGGRYRSEVRSVPDRLLLKARKLRRRLGQTGQLQGTRIPPKPHRMRWHSYLKMRAEIERIEGASLILRTRSMLRRGRDR